MDSSSITGRVAGVATAGIALASVLYDIIHDVRDTPREMIDIARGIRELSSSLKQLRQILKRRRNLFKQSLINSVLSAVYLVKEIHEEVGALLDHSWGGMPRVISAFRKSKATNLLGKIEAHKSTTQLIATTMLLAIEGQRQFKTEGDGERGGGEAREHLRTEAEILVLDNERCLLDLLPKDNRWDNRDYVNDTANWLYNLVFRNDHLSDDSLYMLPIPDASALASQVQKRSVVDRLLLQWTTLSWEEIQDTNITNGSSNQWESRLTNDSKHSKPDHAEQSFHPSAPKQSHLTTRKVEARANSDIPYNDAESYQSSFELAIHRKPDPARRSEEKVQASLVSKDEALQHGRRWSKGPLSKITFPRKKRDSHSDTTLLRTPDEAFAYHNPPRNKPIKSPDLRKGSKGHSASSATSVTAVRGKRQSFEDIKVEIPKHPGLDRPSIVGTIDISPSVKMVQYPCEMSSSPIVPTSMTSQQISRDWGSGREQYSSPSPQFYVIK